MGIPLSQVLDDFGPIRVARLVSIEAESAMHQSEEGAAASLQDCMPAASEGASIYAAVRAEIQTQHERELAEARARAVENLEAARREWTAEQAERLSSQLKAAVEALEAQIAGTVERVLTPFLADEARKAMVSALQATLGTLLSRKRPAAICVSGPDDLLDALRQRMGSRAPAIEWNANGDIEVSVVADQTLIETELQSWAARFSGVAQ